MSSDKRLANITAGEVIRAASTAPADSPTGVLNALVMIRLHKDMNAVDALRPSVRGKYHNQLIEERTAYEPKIDDEGFIELSIGKRVKPRYAMGADIDRFLAGVDSNPQVALLQMLSRMYGLTEAEGQALTWGEFEYLSGESELMDFLDSTPALFRSTLSS